MKLVEVRGSWPNIHVNKYKKKPDDGQYCDLISCGLISWHRSSEKNRNIYIGVFNFGLNTKNNILLDLLKHIIFGLINN